MSLKAFHIFFIALSALALYGFGVWLLLSGAVTVPGLQYGGAVASFAAGTLLVEYGRRFLRRFKKFSFM